MASIGVLMTTTALCVSFHTLYVAYLIFIPRRKAEPEQNVSSYRRRLQLQSLLCMFIALFGILIIFAPTWQNPETCSEEDVKINPDVGGIGVVLGLCIPCFLLLLVLLSGHFKSETSGAKELCIAQCANLMYLAINLMKGYRSLNHLELRIATLSTDLVSASLSMAYSDKDVLAARTLVYCGLILQLFALVVQGVATSYLAATDIPDCSSWAPIFNLSARSSHMLWTYLAFRAVAAAGPVPVAYQLIGNLNECENKSKQAEEQQMQIRKFWISIPATISSSYWSFFSLALLHIVTILTAIRRSGTLQGSWRALWHEWGQSAAFIITIVATLHVLYSNYKLFTASVKKERAKMVEDLGLVKPVKKPWTLGEFPLYGPDCLIVEDTQLREVLLGPKAVDKEVLAEQLQFSFQFDNRRIIDYLKQGAPIDRLDKNGDYPIHLAAQSNDKEILERTEFSGSLLRQNRAGRYPLEIAVETNRDIAVDWILNRMLLNMTSSDQPKIVEAVRQSFKLAIQGEKQDILSTMTRVWINWRTLDLPAEDGTLAPFYYAIHIGKFASCAILEDPSDFVSTDIKLRETYELARLTQSVKLVRRVLRQSPKVLASNSAAYTSLYACEIERITPLGAFNLLILLGYNIRTIAFHALDHALTHCTALWEIVLASHQAKIASYTLTDSILTCWSPEPDVMTELQDRVYRFSERFDKILGLCQREGGRDFERDFSRADWGTREGFQSLVRKYKKRSLGNRVIEVKDERGCSLIHRYINLLTRYDKESIAASRQLYTAWEASIPYLHERTEPVNRPELKLYGVIKLLIRFGMIVEQKDIWDILQRRVPLDLLFFLAAQSADSASTALEIYCSDVASRAVSDWNVREMSWTISLLLRCDANPSQRDSSGKTPRDNLKETFVNRTNTMPAPPAFELLELWERYFQDPKLEKPLDAQAAEWKAVVEELSRIIDPETMSWLSNKLPDGLQ